MAWNINQPEGQVFVGDDKTLELELLQYDPTKPDPDDPANPDMTRIPQDMSGWNVRFVMRTKDGVTGTPTFTQQASIVGTYNASRATNTQRARVTLTDTAATDLLKQATYRYSWKRMDAGFETVLAWGDFPVTMPAAELV